MKFDIRIVFLLFIIYAFIGWVIEVIDAYIKTGKFVNRGFLIGPYCPVYGVGCTLMIILLSKYLDDIVVLFFMCIVTFSILEYMTSFVMEKLFKARWWDYSNKKFNINGRICLETMIPFGLGGVFVMYVVNPVIMYVLTSMPDVLLTIFSIVIGILYTLDLCISVKVISNLKMTAKNIKKDSTIEITRKVKEILSNKNYIKRRLIKAFPKLKIK